MFQVGVYWVGIFKGGVFLIPFRKVALLEIPRSPLLTAFYKIPKFHKTPEITSHVDIFLQKQVLTCSLQYSCSK